MKQLVFSCLFVVPALAGGGLPFLDLSKIGQEQYQDIIINGDVVKRGVRECAARYEAIKPVLDKYKRPITVLDIGASQGYFSLRIAQDYDAVCVMIEGNYNPQWRIADQLFNICQHNTDRNNLIFLKKKITARDLRKLAECEHFDVVLVLNVIHHTRGQWKAFTDAIFALGDNIIIETPPPNDFIATNPTVGKTHRYLASKKGHVLARPPRHTSNTRGTLFWFEGSKKKITLPNWFEPSRFGHYRVESNYHKKQMYHMRRRMRTDWVPGINLSTFIGMNGVYPTVNMLRKHLKGFKGVRHPDLTIWNMILQGDRLALIDLHDRRWNLDPKRVLGYALDLFSGKMPTPSMGYQYRKRVVELGRKR